MIVMGGIIGSGIFINPYVVAKEVHTSALILGAWILGGLTALAGAFIYAELAVLRPNLGGQYAYLRDAFHPAVAFMYGWALLLVMQTGGMAAVAVTFAIYAKKIIAIPLPEGILASLVLIILSAINCLGVRYGSSVQNFLMVLKIGAIAVLVIAGFNAPPIAAQISSDAGQPWSGSLIIKFGAAVVPVLFAYGGWQTASFMTGEMRNPKRDLARALSLRSHQRHRHLFERQYRLPPHARPARTRQHSHARLYGSAKSHRRKRCNCSWRSPSLSPRWAS